MNPSPHTRAGLLSRRRLGHVAGALVGAALTLVGTSAAPGQPRPPSIVFVVADDLGRADVGFHGGRDIPTPHLDRLAKEGVVFSQGYVSGPYCSPTRAGLLTGRYQQRFGHEFNPPGPGATNAPPAGLEVRETTLAARLKSAGYRTGVVGKWHLGFAPQFHPQNRGFDEFFGFLGAAHSFTNAGRGTPNPVLRGREEVDEREHLSTAFTREAVSFVRRHKDQPFFLYLAYNAPHSPLHPLPGHEARFASITDPKRRAFASLLTSVDEGVGEVRAALRESGIEDQTLFVFLSDNGGHPADNTSRNEPFRGEKFQTWEGGVRVPFVARWPGRLPSGAVYAQPVIQLDLFPTALAAAGVNAEPADRLDGVNLLPFLTGQAQGAPHEALYWRFGEQFAIRKGAWKLVQATGVESPQLFNLDADPGESTDLAAAEAGKFSELTADWRRWNAGLVPPAWRPRPRPAGTNVLNRAAPAPGA